MASFDTNGIDLTGQVAVVTGGGRGLGRAMAQALAVANAKVAVVARTATQLAETVELIRKDGGHVLPIPADITDHKAVKTMVQTVQDELGAIDILVNNAGVVGVPGPIWEADPEDWRHTLDVNLYGAFLCGATALGAMVARQHGRIINVASGAGLFPIAFGSAYAVSKAALLRLTECMAADGKEHGIVAFALGPGSVRTAMTEYLIESEAGQTYLPWYRKMILEGGAVPADLSANLVVLLASGKLDSLSGRFIDVFDDPDQLVLYSTQIIQDDLHTLRLRKLSLEGSTSA
jgi:NAD(P)-dependent dehydrogenase (short-subunit alcohol dehydrogenase family)